MKYVVWSVDCNRVNSLKDKIQTHLNDDDDISIIISGSDKFELIELVDRRVSAIIISGDDPHEMRQLLYFFREFNQLLEFIPIALYTTYDVFIEVIKNSFFGIIDFIDIDATDEVFASRIALSLYTARRTHELVTENVEIRSELKDKTKILEYAKQEVEEEKEKVEEAKRKIESLLMNILPEEVSWELIKKGTARPQLYKKVTVLFTDFKGFTSICERLTPDQIIQELNHYFSVFDEIIERYYGERIKTIGDAYMCAGGVPLRNKSNPIDMVLAGLAMQKYMNEDAEKKISEGKIPWRLRCGIHTGKIVAGVIGKKKFAYDIWGDTVNTASRMESSGEAGKVNVSGVTFEYINKYFDCEPRGKIYAKNKGQIDMYFVNGLKEEYRENGNIYVPNNRFLLEISAY